MILGVVVAGKRYPYVKYLFVVMITFGVVLFMYRDEEVRKNNSDRLIGSGELLLVSHSFIRTAGSTRRLSFYVVNKIDVVNFHLFALLSVLRIFVVIKFV